MNSLEKQFEETTGINFKNFYKTHKPKLTWYLSKWTKCQMTAEDFCDEAFIQALRKINTYNPNSSQVHTWLYTIATNLVKKEHEEQKKLQSISIDKELNNNASIILFLRYNDGKDDVEKYRINCKKADIIKETILSLPEKHEKQKRVLIMRELEGMSYKDIADELKLNENTVKSQIKNGRELIIQKVSKKFKLIDNHGL
jgi:RNA polymerase sigma-70 factor (ECF subfamily)